MSGCCGQGPVIVSGAAAAPRLDVETQLMCDVLPDGTVAATVLIEPIYDTSSGARVATRITDPATGDEYTPVGEIQVCAASADCESPTTPVTSVGLCLADGTPIAVTITRDCTEATTSEGWLNLVTGAWSAGAVPAGTVACGDARSIQVSGTFCDVDETSGDVLGLVLVEYTYDDTGAIAAVRLVDAVTGGTYTPTGTVTVCPAGVAQPERDLLQLCDTAGDGTVAPFVRDYARDENGAITGHSDYLLDGVPYTPTGTVGVCAGTEGCRDTSTVLVCDVPADGTTTVTPTITDGVPVDVGQGAFPALPGSYAALWSGGSLTFPAGTGPAQTNLMAVGQLAASPDGCDAATGILTVSVRVTQNGPGPGQLWDGALRIFRGTTLLADDPVLTYAPPGHQETLSLSVPVTAADLAAGDIRVGLALETFHGTAKAWTADQFTASVALEGCEATTSVQFLRTLVTDCETGAVVSTADTTLDGQPYTVTGEVGQCTPASTTDECRNCEQSVLCDVGEEDTHAFLRTVCRDCTGAVISVLDTALDGTAPYAPVGTVGSCGPDGCPTTSVQTIRLCDLDPTVEPDEEGRRCAVPFLRHLAYDCAGAILGFHDTGLDGTTPYAPVQVVDCQCETGEGLTSSIEVPWQTVSVVEDPAGVTGQDFIFTVAPETDPARIGTIRVHVSRPAGGACGAYDINNLVFSNTAAYTLTLDAVAQEMSYLRVDLIDFDTFEPVAVNTAYPLPDRLGGTAGWNATNTRIVPSENNGTGYMYWDNPPETVGWSVLNQGGGTSCSALSFQGMTVEPGGCCGETSGCGECDTVVLCDVPAGGGEPVSFLRHVCRDCQGAVTSVLDTELDGVTAYTAAGTVDTCAEPCRTTFSQVLCEGGGPQTYVSAITNRATDRVRTAAPGPTLGDLDLAPLFAGGSVTSAVPAAGSVAQVQYYGAGDISLPAGEPCGPPDQVEVSFTARFTNNGPGAGQATSVLFSLLNGTTIVANHGIAGGNPGQSFTRLVTASVPTADLLAGRITLGLYVEGVQNNQRQSWTIDQWAMTIRSTSEIPGCGGTEFRRTFVMDCDTGDVTGHFDTTIDGQPYSAVNAVGLCADNDSTGETCRDCEQTVLCDVPTGGVPVPFLRHICRDCQGAVTSVTDTTLNGTTPYTPTAVVTDCGAVMTGPDEATPVSTAIRRLTGAGALDVTTLGDLQSVTVTVIAGSATVTTTDGTGEVPAGVALSWSVATSGDTLLDTFTITTDAADDVLVTATYK